MKTRSFVIGNAFRLLNGDKQGTQERLFRRTGFLFWICCLWIGLVLVLSGVRVESAAARTKDSLKQEIGSLTGKTREETALTRQLLQEDKSRLKEKLESLRTSVHKQEALLQERKERFQGLKEREDTMLQGLSKEQQEITTIQGTVRKAAQDIAAQLKESPLGPEFASEQNRYGLLSRSDSQPGIAEIHSLVETCFDYIHASGRVTRYRGGFLTADGRKASGQIVRFGGLTAVYSTADKVGYLQPGPSGELLSAVPGRPSWSVRRSLQAYLNGEQTHLPLDISGGTVFKRLSREKSWKEWIQSGGLLVWPIFAIAGLALVLVLERLFFILRIRSNSDRIMRTITELAAGDNWEACRAYCSKNSKYPSCQVISKLLANMGQGRQVLENGLQEGLFQQIPRLERFLPTLNVLAAIAPLIGLLGTVTGMISTFQVITIFGSGDPKLMAGGISEALITTQLGLLVAVPILFVHHLLDRRADKILGDIEEKGTGFSLLLLKKENQAPGLSPRSVGLKTQTAARQESA